MPKNMLKGLNIPWITKEGQLDLSKYPIDSLIKQTLSNEEESFR